MVWKVVDYDQGNTINGSAALAAYGQGACLGIAMHWLRERKQGLSALKFGDSISDEPSKQGIARNMAMVQDNVLAHLFNNDGFKYKQGGEPMTEVDSTRGIVNNGIAYAHRLSAMSQWGRQNGLRLQDEHQGFPAGRGGWAAEVFPAMLRRVAPPVYGIVALTGADDGHAMAYEYLTAPHARLSFFDPNFGEWRDTQLNRMGPFIQGHFQNEYDDLDQQWWVVTYR
ncbi:MAG: YopT-type cysteine protease domain-containing protein [Pseudomonadota bacterium]